jgi:hypothetical protein
MNYAHLLFFYMILFAENALLARSIDKTCFGDFIIYLNTANCVIIYKFPAGQSFGE